LWRGRAEIELDGPCSEAVLKALKREVLDPPSERRVRIYMTDNKITIEAEDLRALRATLNSFLYWIYAACESLSQLLSLP